jgi:zinc transporter ZupT
MTRLHPVLWLGALSLVAYVSLGISGPQYDAGGMRSTLFFVAYVVSFPFRWVGSLLIYVNGGEPLKYGLVLTIVAGVVVLVALDRLLTTLGRR